MAKHEIDVRIPQEIWVEYNDLEVQVKANGRRLGRLHISRGTIDWIPVKSQSGYRMRWERFDEVMTHEGRKRPLSARQRRRKR